MDNQTSETGPQAEFGSRCTNGGLVVEPAVDANVGRAGIDELQGLHSFPEGADAARLPEPTSASARSPLLEQLTRREREIAGLIGEGLTSRQIAERLVISERTVDSYAEHVRGKIGLHSRAQIAAWAVSQGLVEHPPG